MTLADKVSMATGQPGTSPAGASVAMSSAWDPALASRYGAVLGAEEHGKGMEVDYGPTINAVGHAAGDQPRHRGQPERPAPVRLGLVG